MIRGTDAQFVFKLPYQSSSLASATITFWQPENKGPTVLRPLPIVRNLENCILSDKQLSVVLDREETCRFSDKRKAYTQLVATTKQGITFASKKQMINVYPVCDEAIVEFEEEVYLDGHTVSSLGGADISYIDGGSINDNQYDVAVDGNIEAIYYADIKHLEFVGAGKMKNWSSDNPAPWSSYAGAIESVLIDQGIENIGANAFTGCTKLKGIVVPNSVTTIDAYAFSGCVAISNYDFTEFTEIPVLADKNAFGGILSTCKIKVPVVLYEDWIKAENWSHYADHISI